jgi:hypothetical protein
MDRQTGAMTDRGTHLKKHFLNFNLVLWFHIEILEKSLDHGYLQTDRQTNRQNKQTDRQTDISLRLTSLA